MKTSTKLIIILFTCIPVSLLAYNLILKNEYINKNFYRDFYPKDNIEYTTTPQLPNFKHIVINGSLKIPQESGFETWMARVWIGSKKPNAAQHDGNAISVIKDLEGNLIARVKNDTLFISFRVKSKYDMLSRSWNNDTNIVKIYTSDVSSIKADFANVTIANNPGNADSLKLSIADNSHYNINNLSLKNLNITAADSSYLNLWRSNRVYTLTYSLKNKSSLSIDENPVQHFNPGQVDSAAIIQITGKARFMQKQLR